MDVKGRKDQDVRRKEIGGGSERRKEGGRGKGGVWEGRKKKSCRDKMGKSRDKGGR